MKPVHAPLTDDELLMNDEEPLWDEKTTARKLNCKVATLQAFRLRGQGPAFIRIGRLVRYAPSDVRSYKASRRVTSTSQRSKK